tara:strand:- start:102 stop:509 length:408 start_codon:yes stop_codon:yes gene_type:complete
MSKKDKMNLLVIFGLVYVVGSLFLSFFIVGKLDFIPHVSFCASNPIILCDIAILGNVVRILNSALLLTFFIWFLLIFLLYFIIKRSPFKKDFEALEKDQIRPETKKEKEKTQTNQILIFIITIILGVIWLVFFDK